MSRKRYAGKPLLYIKEMADEKPNVAMQSTFYSKKDQRNGDYFSVEKEGDKKEHDDGTAAFMRKKHPFFQEVEEDVTEGPEEYSSNDQKVEKDSEHSLKEKEENNEEHTEKRFKDRTLQEKIDYFIGRSNFAPMVRCIVKTETGDHNGWIAESTDEVLKIANRRKRITKEVNTSEILDIEIIGF